MKAICKEGLQKPPSDDCSSAVQKRRPRFLSNAGHRAPSFQQHHISPAIAHFADFLPPADFPKTERLVQVNASDILRKDARLQRPDSCGFCGLDKRSQECPSDSFTLGCTCNVNRNLCDAGVNAPRGNRTQGGPSQHFATAGCYEPAVLQMTVIPLLPGWRLRFEGRIPRGDSFQVNCTKRGPVLRAQRADLKSRCRNCELTHPNAP